MADIGALRRGKLEGIVAGDDFLPYSFLEFGTRRGRAVCRLVVRAPLPEGGMRVAGHGTGFLIAPDLVMTNNHVLPDARIASGSLAQFGYETDIHGADLPHDEWLLDPAAFFHTEKKLDFTIVGIAPKLGRSAGSQFGRLPLRDDPALISVDEPVNVIQHPDGGRKTIVLQNNRVTDFKEGGFLWHTADTLVGSSGSPVFNNQWDLVALHHSGVFLRDEQGTPIRRDGEYQYHANEGVLIAAIVAHLKRAQLSAEQKDKLYPHLFD
ncbi:MAG: serine protease [Pseudomonadota bacterium]